MKNIKEEPDFSFREAILSEVKEHYKVTPEHLWKSYPTYCILRHHSDDGKGKWFGILMNVSWKSLGISKEGNVDILDVKPDPDMLSLLLGQTGFLPGYHMNKQYWLTILLDGSVSYDNILNLLDQSFSNTESRKKGKSSARIGRKDWLIPSNPVYYDIITAFEQEKIIDWKQSSDVHVGDLVYMYVAKPYSAVLYKCKAVEVNIPYHLETGRLNVNKVMRIELLAQFPPDFMPLERMKSEYGVYAVRGPRYIPNSMKAELDRQVR